jgi:hypothetical protein
MPKGNLDVTGQYFIWSSNVGGNRLDAFIVKVPAQLLTGAAPPAPPPNTSTPQGTPTPPGPSTPSNPPSPPVAPPSTAAGVGAVVWTDVVNARASGGSLQKTGGCDGCDDAGAVSQQRLASGDGYVEFTAADSAALRLVGLTPVGSGRGGARIAFAIRLQAGYAEVRENGAYRSDTRFSAGDVFRVAVEAGAVSYYRNGQRFYTSTVAPAYPLQAAAALLDGSASVTSAVLAAGGSAAAATASVRLALDVNQPSFRAGDTMDIAVDQTNPGGAAVADSYFGMLLPSSSGAELGCPAADPVVFFGHDFSGPVLRCLSSLSGAPRAASAGTIASGRPATPDVWRLVWPDDAPTGTYTIFMALLRPGAVLSTAMAPSDVLGMATTTVTFAP